MALRESIYSAVNTQYRGVYLMSGSDATTPPYSRSGDVISSYQGASNIIEVDIDRQMSVPVVIDAGSVLKGDDAEDIFAALDDARRCRSADGDQAGIRDGMSRIDRTFQRLNRALGQVGTDLAMVESQQNRTRLEATRQQHRLDALEDIDLAEAISAMTQADTAYRAAVSAVGKTSQLLASRLHQMNTAELNSESIPTPEPEAGILRVQTRFGEFEADARNILCFPVGLPGFEQCRRFVVLSSITMAPVECLHAVDGAAGIVPRRRSPHGAAGVPLHPERARQGTPRRHRRRSRCSGWPSSRCRRTITPPSICARRLSSTRRAWSGFQVMPLRQPVSRAVPDLAGR